jgi:imidazolonepropionase-like amidohydrolase
MVALASYAVLALAAAPPCPEAPAPFALIAAKALTCAPDEPVVDHPVVLVRDGRIESIGRQGELAIPDGYDVVDAGDLWLMPGMIDLHSHIGGTDDINDMVFQTNPGLRVSATARPGNEALEVALAAGVTTILYIPGSGTAASGQGILMKTVPGDYEGRPRARPGLPQDGPGQQPHGLRRGLRAGALQLAHPRALPARSRVLRGLRGGARARRGARADFDLEIFRALNSGEAQISAHTQQHHVVQATLAIHAAEFHLPVFIDHGEMDAFRGTDVIEAAGVPAILGPRSISWQSKSRGFDHDGRVVGMAAEYQARGLSRIGFNTDSPVVPEESLPLQAGMAVRYGFDDARLDAVRGLTIVPAETAGIAARVGSLEPGKDADVVFLTGHPADPRTSVERVYVEGVLVYDAQEERLW